MAKKKRNKAAEREDRADESARVALGVKSPAIAVSAVLLPIRFGNRIAKKNIFLADHYRDEQDEKVFNNKIREIGLQNFKKNVTCITKIKHMVVDERGDWVTEFIIDMKGQGQCQTG